MRNSLSASFLLLLCTLAFGQPHTQKKDDRHAVTDTDATLFPGVGPARRLDLAEFEGKPESIAALLANPTPWSCASDGQVTNLTAIGVELFRKLSADKRNAYVAANEPSAKRALDEARQSASNIELAKVAQRFRFLPSGRKAAGQLVHRLTDGAEYTSAEMYFRAWLADARADWKDNRDKRCSKENVAVLLRGYWLSAAFANSPKQADSVLGDLYDCPEIPNVGKGPFASAHELEARLPQQQTVKDNFFPAQFQQVTTDASLDIQDMERRDALVRMATTYANTPEEFRKAIDVKFFRKSDQNDGPDFCELYDPKASNIRTNLRALVARTFPRSNIELLYSIVENPESDTGEYDLAIATLKGIGSKRAIDALMRAFENAKRVDRVVEALVSLGQRERLILKAKDLFENGDPSEPAVYRARDALIKLEEKDWLFEVLKRRFEEITEDSKEGEFNVYHLAYLRTDKSEELLTKLLGHPNSQIRSKVVAEMALDDKRLKKLVTTAKGKFDAGDKESLLLAVGWVRAIAHEGTAPKDLRIAVAKAATSRDKEVHEAAMEYLNATRQLDTFGAVLSDHLLSNELPTRIRALELAPEVFRATGRPGNDIAAAVKDPRIDLRSEFIPALGAAGEHAKAEQLLLKELESKDKERVNKALELMPWLSEKRLLKLVASPERAISHAANLAIGARIRYTPRAPRELTVRTELLRTRMVKAGIGAPDPRTGEIGAGLTNELQLIRTHLEKKFPNKLPAGSPGILNQLALLEAFVAVEVQGKEAWEE